MTKKIKTGFNKIDLLRLSVGIIYLWFGVLKFSPELSPAEELAKNTISLLTYGLISDPVAYLILAVWETVIGLFLIFNFCLRFTVVLALIHMIGTFVPLILISDITFNELPWSLTLVGQYIMKNLVVVSALISIFPYKSGEITKMKSTGLLANLNSEFKKFYKFRY